MQEKSNIIHLLQHLIDPKKKNDIELVVDTLILSKLKNFDYLTNVLNKQSNMILMILMPYFVYELY